MEPKHVHFPGHLHPLRFCLGLATAARAAGVQLFENSPAIQISRGAASDTHFVLDYFRLSTDNRLLFGSGHSLALTGMAGKLVAEAIAGQAERFDLFARIKHLPFPGGSLMRTPALVLGMWYFRLRDLF